MNSRGLLSRATSVVTVCKFGVHMSVPQYSVTMHAQDQICEQDPCAHHSASALAFPWRFLLPRPRRRTQAVNRTGNRIASVDRRVHSGALSCLLTEAASQMQQAAGDLLQNCVHCSCRRQATYSSPYLCMEKPCLTASEGLTDASHTAQPR